MYAMYAGHADNRLQKDGQRWYPRGAKDEGFFSLLWPKTISQGLLASSSLYRLLYIVSQIPVRVESSLLCSPREREREREALKC